MIGNIAPIEARPAWLSLPTWQMLQAIEPNTETFTVKVSPNSAEYRGVRSIRTPSGEQEMVEVSP